MESIRYLSKPSPKAQKELDEGKRKVIKHHEGLKMFIGCAYNKVVGFSMIGNADFHGIGSFGNYPICSMAKTPDNKSQLYCDAQGHFIELDIPSRKKVNSYEINGKREVKGKSSKRCVVTHDNKFLVTAEYGKNVHLTKWSVRTKKQLHTWNSDVNSEPQTQSVSYDNKYQMIGYTDGFLGIFDLENNQTFKNTQVMSKCIMSIAFSHDNQTAYICDQESIKMIKWQTGANSENEFDLSEEPKQLTNRIYSICFSKDEKYLFVVSEALLSILEAETRKVIKEFKLTNSVFEIKLIQDGKSAIIAEKNGNLSIIDIETLEISLIVENATDSLELTRIIVI